MLHKMQQKFFVIDGNIGAGKSTFLRLLKQYLNVQVVLEPHEQWQNVGDGHNILEKFYTDTPRWAYTFQSYAFLTRVKTQQEAMRVNPYELQVLERSVFSDRYCFAQSCYEQGMMTALEWQMYLQWFSWLVEAQNIKPTGFIYLRTSPEICYSRLRKRARDEEKTVSLDYLMQLHAKHEALLVEKKGIESSLIDVPVLVLECNADFEENKKEFELHIQQIVSFLAMHVNYQHTGRSRGEINL